MIISRLKGGLGNQLFQYSFAKALSIKYNRKLVIDTSLFSNYQTPDEQNNLSAPFLRDYQLGYYNISSKIINKYLLHIINQYSLKSSKSNFNPLSMIFNYKIISSDNFSFEIVKKYKNIILDGYWQNQELIDKYRTELLKEFKLSQQLSSKYDNIINDINSSNSVSIHIRRGDYVNNHEMKTKFVECDIEYYQKAISHIINKVDDAKYFVFSDDIKWAKKNLSYDGEIEFIDNNGSAYENHYLMSQCKHQIIANSSYSWWAAWLNTNSNKIVLYPKYWYYDEHLNNTVVRIPSNWIQIENKKKNL